MTRGLILAALLTLGGCGGGGKTERPTQEAAMSGKAVADVDAATAEANAAPRRADGTNTAP